MNPITYQCPKCGNFGFPSVYENTCTGCANTKRFGSPYGSVDGRTLDQGPAPEQRSLSMVLAIAIFGIMPIFISAVLLWKAFGP
jgi:hypothetical protein